MYNILCGKELIIKNYINIECKDNTIIIKYNR